MMLEFFNQSVSQKIYLMGEPFESLRQLNTSLLIVYDVLGHFPHPRSHLSLQLSQNFNLRSRNGLLFSNSSDLVVVSSLPDPLHIKWLQSVGFAQGDFFEFPFQVDLKRQSYIETLLAEEKVMQQLKRCVHAKSIHKIFSWMNTANEKKLAEKLDLGFAWKTDLGLLTAHFDKIQFKEIVRKLGLPLLEGFTFSVQKDSLSLSRWHELLVQTFKFLNPNAYLIARPTHAAAGSGIFKFQQQQSSAAFEKITQGEAQEWLVEEYLEEATSINLQLFLDQSGHVGLLGFSEQIFNGFMYKGNQSLHIGFPEESLNECLRQALIVSEDLMRNGYIGLIGLDYVITSTGKVRLIENNIRVNGSTFCLCLLSKLQFVLQKNLVWKFQKFTFKQASGFREIAKKFSTFLWTGDWFQSQGLFIQEYFQSDGEADLALIYWGEDEKSLRDLEEFIIASCI